MPAKHLQIPLPGSAGAPAPAGALEERAFSQGFRCVAGLDEVGRGPLAGPVVAAAVVFPRGYRNPEIKDSKLLAPGRREALADAIKRDAIGWGIGVVGVEEIDRINILRATLLAMAKALLAMRPLPDLLLIDGRETIGPELLFERYRSGVLPHQRTVVKGDRVCVSIAAASILAKVARDALMIEIDKAHPEYGFALHKGYGCAAHLEALRRLGPSPFHRRSFRPVREACAAAGDGPDLPLLRARR
ncbi:MAG TPA: ribonuclease HII [candidate division Zixibacteria bacterium]|nr:ribonuclease HII [candidate division Zixibacteria bacterium]